MTLLYLLFLIAALVCFVVAAFSPRQPARVNLVALGLAFFVLVPVVQTFQVV